MGSIRAKFIVAALLLVVVTSASGFISFWSTGWLKSALAENTVLAHALRNQGSADMMHDALRGDVIALCTQQAMIRACATRLKRICSGI
jgi:methyl-accepting chemotaxis protein